ncbi:MAG: hypothetical protein MJE63_33320 [Proteobacteria bacterium]|nr:hypothetical protein [Pseudomonadota bacterium]
MARSIPLEPGNREERFMSFLPDLCSLGKSGVKEVQNRDAVFFLFHFLIAGIRYHLFVKPFFKPIE